MMISATISAVCLACVVYAPDLSVIAVGALLLLFGICSGAFMLGFAMAQEMNTLAVTATAVAFINTGEAIFSAFSDPLVGRLLDQGWDGTLVNGARQFSVNNYQHSLLILVIYLVLAVVSTYMIKTKSNKR